jgi:hypothetical protein
MTPIRQQFFYPASRVYEFQSKLRQQIRHDTLEAVENVAAALYTQDAAIYGCPPFPMKKQVNTDVLPCRAH